MNDKLIQLELDMDRVKRDIHELRDILIHLSYSIAEIDKKITEHINEEE